VDNLRHTADVVIVLAQRDFKVRYRNSVLGFLWSLLNPLAYMAVLTLVFSLLLRVNIPDFAAWELIGLLIWRFFSVATGQSLLTISGNPSLVSKVRISRPLIVLSNNLANFIGSCLEFLVLLPLLMVLGVNISISALAVPLILVLEFLLVFGVSLALSALNVEYQDFYQLWTIALQLGFFLTPIVYDASLIPARFSFFYSLNPVTRLIEAAREALLNGALPTAADFAVILGSTAIMLILGVLIFSHYEKTFAEVV
jgi:lipopolysaccharide transport system permease protein